MTSHRRGSRTRKFCIKRVDDGYCNFDRVKIHLYSLLNNLCTMQGGLFKGNRQETWRPFSQTSSFPHHFNLANHSTYNVEIFRSFHTQENTQRQKCLYPTPFISWINSPLLVELMNSCFYTTSSPSMLFRARHKPHATHKSPVRSNQGLPFETSASWFAVIFSHLSTRLIPNS